MTDLQATLEALISFVQRERASQVAEETASSLLSSRALVALGYAISDLAITRRQEDVVILKCPANASRFRPGDRLTFQHPVEKPFHGTLIELGKGGLELHIRVSGKFSQTAAGPWLATENMTDLSNSVINALQKLQPGGPGWGFVRRLLGETPVGTTSFISSTSAIDPHTLYQQLADASHQELDASQQKVFDSCVSMPPTLGVQGPPGTGKTHLLAFVAEALVRQDKQVVILAPTHQAINHALSTLHSLFPSRPVVKVGDELRTESLSSDIRLLTDRRGLAALGRDTIVGMTFMSALHRLMVVDGRPINPNVVIIDEAGQLPLAHGICAALCGAGSIQLFGDDKQMPPVFTSEVAEDPLAISIFAQLRSAQPDAIMMLDTSYRLNEELCHLIGNAFYSESAAPLLSSESARNRRLDPCFAEIAQKEDTHQALDPQRSLVWVQIPTRSCTQFNSAEAVVVVDIVRTCLQAGLPANEIAVVTPFRRQAMRIRSELSEALDNANDLPIIDTVERIQGATVDIVVVSFCASEPDYVTSIANFLFSPNRLNVAVSRARRKAIVVSSPDIFTIIPTNYQGIKNRDLARALLSNSSL